MSEVERYAVIETALCIGGNVHDGEVLMVRADEHDRELAALREELARITVQSEQRLDAWIKCGDLRDAAEQRNAELIELLNRVVQLWAAHDTKLQLADSICKFAPVIRDTIKPTESGASE